MISALLASLFQISKHGAPSERAEDKIDREVIRYLLALNKHIWVQIPLWEA
jgi:hypothetical protein